MTVVNNNAPKAVPAAVAPKVDKLKELESRASQLYFKLISPQGAPASTSQLPDVQAITALAKSVTAEDFSNKRDHQLTFLLASLMVAVMGLTTCPKDKSVDAAINALNDLINQIKKMQNEVLLLKKVDVLKRFFLALETDPDNIQELGKLVQEAKAHFNDRDFLFLFFKAATKVAPAFLCSILNEFPFTDKDDILQLGSLLDEAADRAKFAAHFKITPAEMEKAHAQRLKSLKMKELMFDLGGDCHGHSLVQSSQNPPKDPAAYDRKTLFIQVAYQLQLKTRRDGPECQQLGRAILDAPNSYPKFLAEAAQVLGYASVEDLLFDDMNKKSPLQLAERIGRLSFSMWGPEVATDETRAFQSLLNKLPRYDGCPFEEETPLPIMKRLGLQPGTSIAPAAPLTDLQKNLMALGDKSGKILLKLIDGGQGHAISLCFDPPSFSDRADADLRTLHPTLRTYESQEEMIAALRKHILLTYGETYKAFELIRYLPTAKAN